MPKIGPGQPPAPATKTAAPAGSPAVAKGPATRGAPAARPVYVPDRLDLDEDAIIARKMSQNLRPDWYAKDRQPAPPVPQKATTAVIKDYLGALTTVTAIGAAITGAAYFFAAAVLL